MAIRLGALVLVALIGFSFIAFDVLGYRLGAQPFTVTVQLPRGGGLYSDGFVTFRGVDVGRIASLNLTANGAVATLDIDPGTRIPANAIAHVHELSVAGEQYLDLVPTSAAGPDLQAGSVIGVGHTNVPVSVYTLLDNAGQLIASINASEVNTNTTALGIGNDNTGQDLRTITVAAQNLVKALEAAQSATVTIINGGGQVLSAAQASSSDITAFSQSLQQITAQLASSNADVSAVLAKGAPTEQALNQLVQVTGRHRADPAHQELRLPVRHRHRVQPAVDVAAGQLPTFFNKIADTANGGSVAVSIYYNSLNTVCPYVPGSQTPVPTASTSAPPSTASATRPRPTCCSGARPTCR